MADVVSIYETKYAAEQPHLVEHAESSVKYGGVKYNGKDRIHIAICNEHITKPESRKEIIDGLVVKTCEGCFTKEITKIE